MNKTMQISVIIPTFNRQSELRRALRSVLRQTRQADEIVVVDDGSEDETREMVQTEFPRVKYHYQSNRGVSSARNTGISLAMHPWIALLDSDDEWLPQKLDMQCAALQGQPEMLLCHTDEIWIRRGKRVNPMHKHQKFGGYIYEKCLPLCAISPSSVMLHRKLIDEIGLFDESLPACEDYDMWLRLCSRYSVLYIDEPLIVKYGGHEDQLSRKHWGMDRFRIQALKKILDGGDLQSKERQATVDIFIEKCRIYILGAIKRGKTLEAAHYQSLIDQYTCSRAVSA